MKRHISSFERLHDLPPIFHRDDLTQRFQWSDKIASQYLYLWKKRELVQGLGGHSNVFANRLVAPKPNWDIALFMAMPSAVIIGVDAINWSHRTTQFPYRIDVAVASNQPVFKIAPPMPKFTYVICPRSPEWFEKVYRGNGMHDHREDGALSVLKFAWALADMLVTDGWERCGLGPDDIEWEEVTEEDKSDWIAASKAFGLPPTELMDHEVDNWSPEPLPPRVYPFWKTGKKAEPTGSRQSRRKPKP
ncbi:MAG: hypothetical protein LBQ75_08180 [Zoogloeaceae bacterium]|jgi:hypothetical protein|nr:hypothetical protein [Zoogloeaceae bacterium]